MKPVYIKSDIIWHPTGFVYQTGHKFNLIERLATYRHLTWLHKEGLFLEEPNRRWRQESALTYGVRMWNGRWIVKFPGNQDIEKTT